MKKILIIVSAIILVLVSIRFASVKVSEYGNKKALEARKVTPVGLSSIKEVEIYDSIELQGRVESQNKVDLVARIDGYLQKKHFAEGDYVKKGQLLITIEPTQYLNNLNKAKAELESAKATLYKAQRDYERGAELVKKDFISKSTYDGLKADKERASASVKAASSALSEAQRNYGYTSIKSPVDGKIGALNIQEGNYVTVQSGTLATVTKTNPIYVKYSIDSKQFDSLRDSDFIPQKGSAPIKVEVVLPSGKVYPVQGVQDFWDNQISASTGTIDFRATFNNDDQTLIPGDFVKVKVYSNKPKKVLVVPQDLALEDSTGRYVYVTQKMQLKNEAKQGLLATLINKIFKKKQNEEQNEQVEQLVAKPRYFKDGGQYKDENENLSYWIIEAPLSKDEAEFKAGDKFISTNLTKLMSFMPVKIIQEQTQQEQ